MEYDFWENKYENYYFQTIITAFSSFSFFYLWIITETISYL